MYVQAKKAHDEIYRLIALLKPEVEKCRRKEELVDYAYALYEAHKFIDDLEGEVRRLKERAICLADALWVQESTGESIRTDYCTATPDIKMAANIPSQKRDPEAFDAFMQHLGIKPELYKGESEVVRPHWPGLVEYVSALISQGKPLPPGVNMEKKYPVYKMSFRKKKEPSEIVS